MTTATPLHGDFATRLYDKLATTQEGNLFLSPFSIQVALAMCAVGAKGQTRKVMAELIGAPESVDEQNRQYDSLLKSVLGEGDRPFQLTTANALWAQQGFRFQPSFNKALEEFYDGAFNEVDFHSHANEAVKTINAWVSDETQQKIKELLQRDDIKSDTRLILTNAIYFKGRWEKEFSKKSTKEGDWHGPDGIVRVPMMHQQSGFWYCEDGDMQALDLPYKGGHLSMLVVLPWKMDGLTALESQWAVPGTTQKLMDCLKPERTVVVSLPRFKLETTFKLKPVLSAMGAGLAFDAGADFSGIGDEALLIAEVIHKAFVEVNEEGTEAAAATAVLMGRGAMVAREPKVFNADHPFLFFIRDRKTNAVLFCGRVLDPK
jgi:serpin B